MKPSLRDGTVLLVLAIALGVVATVVRAQDPVKAPDHSLLFENDQVRVCEFTAKPGETVALDSRPNHFAYMLAPAKMKFTTADGKVVEREYAAGDIRWSDAVTHTVENIGDTQAKALVVELKGPAKKQKK
ncbi:MAG: cytoplasmic protein [Candidatus Eisenbacteria bacterium]|uniref:Cytoplasmic protein n=1 Tax=Eiseniibacteriota bacterium TaxID=2212470 RepID=A0A538TWH7_UNCEI|nr:MAG: cytoplasmic protein [Candidatus Eisenbacteria bacterium]